MNPELAWMVAIFCIGRKPSCEVSMASASQTVRTALEGLIWRSDPSEEFPRVYVGYGGSWTLPIPKQQAPTL